jgi:release factor glutamine methyltransferase
MTLSRRLCRVLIQLVYRPYVLWRIRRPSEARLFGRDLLTDPEVFHPTYFFSTRILADHLGTLSLEGKRFLDMGTGSGPIGIQAAGAGASVTACDINPRAVRLAAENARRNGFAMEVVHSDLFSALEGRSFDVICFNVPFYATPKTPPTPAVPLDAAFFAGPDFETIRTFASQCSRFLAPGGVVIVLFSEDSGRDRMLSIFQRAGLTAIGESVASRFFERFHVLCLRPAAA